jgi:Fe-S oxidoreductase
MVREARHTYVCPSIARYNFHTYSGGGRLSTGVALLDGEIGYTDRLLEVVYNCQLCGACDVSCKYALEMEVLEPINELRIKCVADGHTLPSLDKVIEGLRESGAMMPGAGEGRGKWAEGLDIKDASAQPAKVLYHAGCRTCYDEDRWPAARAAISLLRKAGVDFGILGDDEACCGGRAYQMGYEKEFLEQAGRNMELFRRSGVEMLVTGCADCYHAFKVLYDKFGLKGNLEVLHTTEYLARLLDEGRLKPEKEVKARVTYHDPCRLGRLGEPCVPWQGQKDTGHWRVFDPPKEYRRGTYGVYEPPREILRRIPGLELAEMDRKKEYAWCCGAGGGVAEANPGFARWTAEERLREAAATGAKALVTACPGCGKSFADALKGTGNDLKVYDIAELLAQAV